MLVVLLLYNAQNWFQNVGSTKKKNSTNLVLILFSLGMDQLKNYSKIKDVHYAMIKTHIFLS